MKIIKSYPAKPFAYIYERVAAKDHVCDCCNKNISAGTSYFNKRGIRKDHSFYEFKYCNPCYSTKNI